MSKHVCKKCKEIINLKSNPLKLSKERFKVYVRKKRKEYFESKTYHPFGKNSKGRTTVRHRYCGGIVELEIKKDI